MIKELKFPAILDNTILSRFAACPTQAFLSHFLHLKPRGTQVHLDAGKVYALGLEQFRLAYWSEDSPIKGDSEACKLHGLRAMIKAWGYDEDAERAFSTTNKSFHRIVELYLGYFNHFGIKTDCMEPYLLNGKPAVECSFSIPLEINHPDTGDPLLFHGRFDTLSVYMGAVFGHDDKTASQLGATWPSKWELRSQFSGYVYGAKQMGLPVVGMVVRGAACYANGVGYAESITRRTDKELDQWYNDVHVIAEAMISCYLQAKDRESSVHRIIDLMPSFPAMGKFNESCNAYSGCEFRDMCKSSVPARCLDQFVTRVWDPRNPDGEES